MKSRPLLPLLLLLPLTCAHAEVYKWTDAQGNVHFTDQPSAAGKAETLNIKTQPHSGDTPSPPSPADSLERQKKLLQTMDKERVQKAAEQKKQNEEKQKRQLECARLKDEQRRFAQGGRFYEVMPNGERKYKSDEEITRRREEVNRAVDKCR